METVFWFCSIVGGTIMVCQFVLTLMGMGGEGGDTDAGGHDVDVAGDVVDDLGHHSAAGSEPMGHDSTNFLFGVLTFRTLVAGFAFFGLTGLAVGQNFPGVTDNMVLLSALAAGAAAIFIVYWIMRSLSELNADGTLRIQRAIGLVGTVYLSIPAAKSGTGKVHVEISNRTMEFNAITASGDLPTGTKIKVIGLVGMDTLEVSPVESMEPTQVS